MDVFHVSFPVLDILSGNSVERPSSLAGDNPGVDLQAVPLLVLPDQVLLLELLQAPPDGLGASGSVRLRGAVAALEPSVDVRKQADASVRPEVDLAGEGGHLDVDPVVIEGREFVACVTEEVRGPVLT